MKTKNINIRISKRDCEYLKAQSERNDMNVSEYIRWLIAKEREMRK